MFFKQKKDNLSTSTFLDSQKDDPLSTEVVLEQMENSPNALPKEDEINFWDEKEIRQEIATDITNNWKSVNLFAKEACVDRSLLVQWLSMNKNMNRDRILCVLITLYGKQENPLKRINNVLKALNNIDGFHIHNARDYTIFSGIRNHLSIDELDMQLREKNLGGFENMK